MTKHAHTPIGLVVGLGAVALMAIAANPVDSARPPITIYGRPGSFGTATQTSAVPTWGFLPGQAAYFTAVDPAGRVLVANEPQTDNQVEPTAQTMAVSVFDPAAMTFTNVTIPTSTGATVATNSSGVGGADVGDLHLINGTTLAVTSTAPWHGYDPTLGVYPALATLTSTPTGWTPASSFTAAQLREASTAGAVACGRTLPWTTIADCGGLAELDLLPKSMLLVATRYFGHPEAGATSGGLAVLDPSGRVVASLDYPTVPGVTLRPREVNVDPTSKAGDERFVVIFDVFGQPFVAQVFRFTGTTIEALSAPFRTSGAVGVGPETATFDQAGTLWIAEARSRTLEGGRIVRFTKATLSARLAKACAATPGNIAGKWGAVCTPDASSTITSGKSLVRSLTPDPKRGRVIAVTIDGTVAWWNGSKSKAAMVLPLGQLVDRTRYAIGPRKGTVDAVRDWLWVPIHQIRQDWQCPTGVCAPTVLDQWLVRIDLGAL